MLRIDASFSSHSRPSPMIQRLLLVINHDSVTPANRSQCSDVFPLMSSTVFDPSGNTTTLEFKNVKMNREVPDSTFHFTIPSGVEVVHPTVEGMGY